ncbi:MAG TPA: phosphatase PAP2 family protein [Tepidisphaeraceae bacterium]|nr:phosphatase PAP2 family protein [Tepidisphaeraceae bacterium]
MILAIAWLALFVVALPLDRSVAVAVHNAGIDARLRGSMLAEIVKTPGTFYFAIAIAILGLLTRQVRRGEGVFVLLASAMSGINGLIKWLVGRTRPFKLTGPDQPQPFHFEPLWHGVNGLFHQKDLCFPSGHACTAFALATAVALIRPRWSPVFFAIALLVAAERVLENAHYLSDTVAAAGVGAGGTLFVWWLMCRFLKPPLLLS